MTKQRVRRQAKRHRGVKVIRFRDGRHVARFRDPLTGKEQQVSLDKLGYTNDEGRRAWARDKSKGLAELARSISLGTVKAERVAPRAAADACLAKFTNAGTKAARRVVFDEFVEWCQGCGIRTMADVSGVRLMAWRDRVLDPNRNEHMASTRNRHLADSRYFLRWCIDRGYSPLLTLDAVKKACKPDDEPKRAIEILRPPGEVRKALEAAIAHDALPDVPRKIARFVLLLLLSGMRIAEAVGLLWSEVDFEADEIRLPPERVKTKAGRAIPWRETPWLGKLLRTMRDEASEEARAGRVFENVTGPTWASSLYRMIEKCGMPAHCTAHVFRKTTGTVLTCAKSIYSAASVFLASRRQGHRVQIAERHYLGVLRDLPDGASTLEQACGIEDLCKAIVAAQKD